VAIQLTPGRFTAAEYHQMLEAGVFAKDERLELIDGEIVQMSDEPVPAVPGPRAGGDAPNRRSSRLWWIRVANWGMKIVPIQCPRCGSLRTPREDSRWEWLWLIAAAGSFFLRFLLTFARYGEYRGEPGVYRCANCGRAFTFFVLERTYPHWCVVRRDACVAPLVWAAHHCRAQAWSGTNAAYQGQASDRF